jgi:hypothetical protein
MANQTITQLPTAGPITGTELVPIVQNGGTFKTTASALAGSPVQTQTFLTLNQEPTLNNSRFLSSGTGVGLVDGGAQSFYRITLNGVSGTLEAMGNGFAVKVGGTMTPRSIATSGAGVAVTNGDGQSGNPTIALDGTVASLANSSGTGFLALPGNGTVSGRTLTGTANQIGITNPNGIAGNPTFSIADNPVLPGDGGVVVPVGNTAARPAVPTNGTFRYNSQTGTFEGYASGNWGAVVTGTGVTSVGLVMPAQFTVTNSPVTSAGDLTAAWASQTANYVLAAPNGSAGVPTFRAFVNADLPNSGVSANTYGSTTAIPVITVNAKGVVTSVTTAAITGGLVYQGSWNASTNTPALASGVGVNGYYYVVSVAGSTNLDGITDWQVGDWAIYNGTAWQKIDQTNLVSSVNGQVGAVSIAYADLAGAIPTWNQNTTGTAAGLSSTLAIASGGTGQTTASAAFNALSPITTTGDLILGNGTNSATRLGIGANGYLLTSNGTTASWVAAPAGGVTSFAGGTTGLTPASATTGAISLAGTLAVANGGTGRTVGNYSIYANEIHVGKDGNDTTGDGTLINPVLTITKALTLVGAGRNTVIVHPGSYSESPTASSANITIATTELTGANTQISGTLTLSAAARISGLKITNLTITGSGNTYISNCTVDTQVIKSGSNYVEIINSELQCTLGVQISGAGTVSIIGNKCWAVAVSNASANVLIKDCFQVLAPSITAGTLQFDGSAIFAASPASNAVTSSAGSFITLANCFVLNSAGNNVERVSLAGFYSILNLVYDKTNSTFAGTNLNAIDYFSVINADTLVLTNDLAIAYGGTNSSATPTAGGAAYGTGLAYAFTAAGTEGQVLTSAGAGAPVWSGISGGTF